MTEWDLLFSSVRVAHRLLGKCLGASHKSPPALLSGQLLLTDSMFLRIQDIVLLCRHGTPFFSKHTSSDTCLQENLSCLPLINTLNLDACFLPLQNHMHFWRLRKHIFLFYCPSQPGTCTQWVLVDYLLSGAAKSKRNVLPSHNGLFLFLNVHQELHHGFLHGVWVWWVCQLWLFWCRENIFF